MGDVISVFSCSGGCGATTTAVNVATELKLAGDKPVLLVDLDPHYGSIAQYLNVHGKFGVAHILNRENTIDRHLVESSAIRYIEGLDVLLSPAAAEADRHKPMNYENLLRVLEACRESYGYVVVDAPRLPHEAAIDLASVTRVAIVVLRLTVRDVSFAQSLIASLTEQGMASDRILVLANQAGRRGGLLSAGEVQKALDKPLFRVRSDCRKAARSITYGQPLAHFARMSGLRRDFRKVTGQVQQWTSNGHLGKGGA
jgi:pilus assembly protein CpaE